MKTFLILIFASLFFVSCLKENEIETYLDVPDFVLINNNIYVNQAANNSNFWIVVRREGTTGNEGIVAKDLIRGGQHFNFLLAVDSGVFISNNENFVAVMHEDNGEQGVFEYTESGSFDQPVVSGGNMVKSEFYLREPMLSISDQALVNDSLKVDSVVVGLNGWISVFIEEESGNLGDLVGLQYLPFQISKNFRIPLDTGITTGTKLTSFLYLDFPPYQFFSTESDRLEMFNNDTVKVTITVQ